MEVLCKFSEVTVPAHEKADWWCHVTGANVRGISPESWIHKPHPRSSSVGSRASIPNMRPRKSSVSPSRRHSECTNVLNNAILNAESFTDEIWAACAGKMDPYFSNHPPTAPVEVLIIGAPLKLPNGHTLAVSLNLEQESDEQVWLTPRLQCGPPPCACPPRASRSRIKAEGAARRPSRGSRRAVRHLLRDLIASLPLLAPGEDKENDTQTDAEGAPSVETSVSAQAEPPAPPPPATCSVAVQAQSLSSHVDKGIMGSHLQLKSNNVSVDDAGEKRARTPDAWVGGARALRDSHVRLVLRQLRHIERLNRALDHAVPALKHKQ